jgi:hypothetical protein
MDWNNLLLDMFKIALGGLIGGGIVAWIEWKRYGRQKSEWKLSDKKIDIRVVDAYSTHKRWSVSTAINKDEELRIYKSKLDGKLEEWKYLVIVSVVNTSPNDILVLSAELELPQINIQKIQLSEEYKRPQELPFNNVYNYLSKEKLNDIDFPLKIEEKSTNGLVFFGGWYFDAPNLVDMPPSTATVTFILDDKSEHRKVIKFEEKEYRSFEDAYTISRELHWMPHVRKFGENYDINNEKEVEAQTNEVDEIPF